MESYGKFICISDEAKEKIKNMTDNEFQYLAEMVAASMVETSYEISQEAWEKEFKNV